MPILQRLRDIVCISTNYWNGEWFRKQQFMSRLAEAGHRVLFVEPSYSLARSAKGRDYIRNRIVMPRISRAEENLWVLTPRRMMPGVSRPAISRLNAGLIGRQVSGAVRDLGFRSPLLWAYPPEILPGIRWIPHSGLVLDLVDDLVAYEVREWRKNYVRGCITGMVRQANRVICTSERLAERYAPSACVIPNGFDSRLFDPSTHPAPELSGDYPVVGFIGTLFRYIDFSLIAEVAKRLPDAKIALVGRVADDGPELERLLAMRNVVHIPQVPRGQVPAYVAAFDVCLVPFKVDEVSANASPLKAYEYLAMGKPVVSVDMPSLASDPLTHGVIYARDRAGFVDAVEASLGSGPEHAHSANTVARASWDGRFKDLVDAVAPLLEAESLT